jgi:glycosyltransferase involved in cell wall biosynthesis
MSEHTPIIAFSKDWHEDHTSNHHVLRELAKTRRVLWLNSVGTRKPSMSSARDLGKIKRKLTEFAKGAINVENDLWVATPLVLPLPHNAIATKINQQIIRATIRVLRYQLGIKDFQLWTFLPNIVDFVGTLGEKLAVYYCVDEWSTFTALDAQATIAAEKRLLKKVDVTFCTSQALVDSKSPHTKLTQFAPHGVNFASFARAMQDDLEIPADLAKIPHPRLGFFGTLRDLIDYQLIEGMARARPDVHIALIGQKHVDLAALEALPNVHFLGQKKHDELAAYCKGFDVGWIPYRIDDNVKFINPLKLREYLSAGVPVISTSMPEVLPFKHLAHIADTPEETSAAFDKAMSEGALDARKLRCESMRNETWPARVARIGETVDAIERSKESPRVVSSTQTSSTPLEEPLVREAQR